MNIESKILKPDERVACVLRSLYRNLGYCQYKMSKFEEYALYVRNKDFLVSDGIISFTDTNGRLLALKPDVTLSIINNSKDLPGQLQKLYYDENVYRISKSSRSYKEIRQTGLECIGDIGLLEVCEVMLLAVRSLESISSNYIFELSHEGIVESVFEDCRIERNLRNKILSAVSRKSVGELELICKEENISDEIRDKLLTFTKNFTSVDDALVSLEKICKGDAGAKSFEEFAFLVGFIREAGFEKNIKVDFSLTNDMSYYSGIVFKGYIKGIPSSILSGGQYDKLMKKMGRSSGAVGFAVYLDALERFDMQENEYDVDIVLLHSGNIAETLRTAESLSSAGNTVRVCTQIPKGLRYRHVLNVSQKEES